MNCLLRRSIRGSWSISEVSLLPTEHWWLQALILKGKACKAQQVLLLPNNVCCLFSGPWAEHRLPKAHRRSTAIGFPYYLLSGALRGQVPGPWSTSAKTWTHVWPVLIVSAANITQLLAFHTQKWTVWGTNSPASPAVRWVALCHLSTPTWAPVSTNEHLRAHPRKGQPWACQAQSYCTCSTGPLVWEKWTWVGKRTWNPFSYTYKDNKLSSNSV